MQIDDPRLTAYVLGELDPAGRAEVERLMQSDEDAAREVVELRAFTSSLRTRLAAEEAPALAVEQRAEILAKAQPPPAANKVVSLPAASSAGDGRLRVWLPAALAACLAAGGVVATLMYEESGRRPGRASGAAESARERVAGAADAEARRGDRDLPATAPAPGPFTSEPAPAGPPQPALATAKDQNQAGEGLVLPTLDKPREVTKGGSPGASTDDLRLVPAATPTAAGKSSSLAIGADFFKADAASRKPDSPMTTPLSTVERGVEKTKLGDLSVARSKSPAPEPEAMRRGFPGSNNRWFLAGQTERAESDLETFANDAARPRPELQQTEAANTDGFDSITDNAFLPVRGNELSTFSVDVDTASYSVVRRFLTSGQRPPKGAVRIEELINYFDYSYPAPKEEEPFSVNLEVAACPWMPEHRLVRVGLKAREVAPERRPAANLVFLLDVSGSMQPANRLPLLKECLREFVEKLGPEDTVAIAVYAGASGTVLAPTSDKKEILHALERLDAGGSTNGAAGIRLAYDLAKTNFAKGKINRVILATDGDFNVGTTDQSQLVELITSKAKSGVFLTVLGVGYGNLKDSTLEKLADKGNGNYAYLDTIGEGRRVLIEQMSSTLMTVAKDVKVQVEFNPGKVSAYRLIGYENRVMAKEDFNDDKKDAGDVGAGQAVTALYEVAPVGVAAKELTQTDPLRYGREKPADRAELDLSRYARDTAAEEPAKNSALAEVSAAAAPPRAAAAPAIDGSSAGSVRLLTARQGEVDPNELLTLKLRWKAPDGEVSSKKEYPLVDSAETWERSSRDFRWSAAVAGFGMLLRESPYAGSASWSSVRELAVEGQGADPAGRRQEFLNLLDKASQLGKK